MQQLWYAPRYVYPGGTAFLPEPSERQCVSCKNPFYDSGTRKRRRYYCRACEHNYFKSYTRKNPEKMRDSYRKIHLRNLYGITPEKYNEMSKIQNGVCAICSEPETLQKIAREYTTRSLAVDHDKVTGQIRGLLCNKCNRGIGLLKSSPHILELAADYLRKFGKE